MKSHISSRPSNLRYRLNILKNILEWWGKTVKREQNVICWTTLLALSPASRVETKVLFPALGRFCMAYPSSIWPEGTRNSRAPLQTCDVTFPQWTKMKGGACVLDVVHLKNCTDAANDICQWLPPGVRLTSLALSLRPLEANTTHNLDLKHPMLQGCPYSNYSWPPRVGRKFGQTTGKTSEWALSTTANTNQNRDAPYWLM